jgi:hypothetical protein
MSLITSTELPSISGMFMLHSSTSCLRLSIAGAPFTACCVWSSRFTNDARLSIPFTKSQRAGLHQASRQSNKGRAAYSKGQQSMGLSLWNIFKVCLYIAVFAKEKLVPFHPTEPRFCFPPPPPPSQQTGRTVARQLPYDFESTPVSSAIWTR